MFENFSGPIGGASLVKVVFVLAIRTRSLIWNFEFCGYFIFIQMISNVEFISSGFAGIISIDLLWEVLYYLSKTSIYIYRCCWPRSISIFSFSESDKIFLPPPLYPHYK